MSQRHSNLAFHILRCATQSLAESDVKAVLELGFTIDQIAEIEQLTLEDINYLMTHSQHFINARVDPERFERLIAHMRLRRKEGEVLNELIRHHASLPMLNQLYGMNSIEYARLRKKLHMVHGFDGKQSGRPKLPRPELHDAIWEVWQDNEHLPVGERYLAVAKATKVPLNAIWQLMKTWDIPNVKVLRRRNGSHSAAAVTKAKVIGTDRKPKRASAAV
jgi:hypothetical protein